MKPSLQSQSQQLLPVLKFNFIYMNIYKTAIFFVLLTLTSCKKNHTKNICNEIKQPSGKFIIGEMVGDTAFVGLTGSKNFYWFSNMPEGFIGETSASFVYPELRNGISIAMSYKCFSFNYDSHHEGKAGLSNDTLNINYGNNLVGKRNFIGKKI